MRYIFFILFFLFFPFVSLAQTEDFSLGSFSGQNVNTWFSKNIILKTGETATEVSGDQIRGWIREIEDLSYNPAHDSEIENVNFCQYKKSIPCALTLSLKDQSHVQKISEASLNIETLNKFLDELSLTVDKNPENATLQMEDSKVSVFALSKNGVRLDKEKSLITIFNYFKNNSSTGEIKLAYDELQPEITTDSIDNLGIKTLIGEGTSNFAGSPKNRIHNIYVGAKKFNGVLIKPGEKFSFIQTLGPVDESTGYLPELVIKTDKTVPEFGGGMCQVSTTAFRAAIYAGLKITARTPHAYPVSYYNPQGMDATVYIPSPDLRFINNTPGHILIQTKIDGTRLVFDFFGTDDGRKINITGPKITERNSDGSMKATFTQEVLDKDGNQLIEDIFNSAYDSPSKYPHPGEEVFKEKPRDWTQGEWKAYKKLHNL
ncbi:MAG: VanW family protein [Parcubacteria group bacterium]